MLAAAAAACAVWLLDVEPARADELADFEHARQAYEAQDYPHAVERFVALVGGETPRLTTRALVLESRKYLAASYLFTHDEAHAEDQLARLLREDPTFEIDPTQFPAEVRALFARVRLRLAREAREAVAAAQAAALRHQQEVDAAERQERDRMARLRRLASEEVVHESHSRFVAALPFGIGQLQNGDSVLGITLLVVESVFAVSAATTAVWHATLPSPPNDGRVHADLQFAEDALTVANWISAGGLVLAAIIGVIEAEVRFAPDTRTVRHRPLPHDLAHLEVGPLSVGLRVDL